MFELYEVTFKTKNNGIFTTTDRSIHSAVANIFSVFPIQVDQVAEAHVRERVSGGHYPLHPSYLTASE